MTKLDASNVATKGLSLNSAPSNQPTTDSHASPTLPQAHNPPHPQIPHLPPTNHAPTSFSKLGPVFPLDHNPPQTKFTSLPSPVSRPSPHPSSPPKTSPRPPNATSSPSKITDTLTIHSNIPHTPNHTLKRKISEDELSTFTKRLRETANSTEPTFFDPITSTLIPQSEIESFILEEENKAHSPFIPKVHGKPLKGKARNLIMQTT